ncbi:hypothetical protein RhiirB3_438539 [Rhizophagus irregularis]|nr:hypothetical protein RhiirB3_438539 [Rhizophagus irregularis]
MQLPIDCLNNIFEHLESDKVTLYSCLLVNRLWCKLSVRILWSKIRNYNTLISCLPNESKEILLNNGILITNSKPPIFNYASFCKFLSIYEVNYNNKNILKRRYFISVQNLDDNIFIVSQEIFKLLMGQIPSLRKITFLGWSLKHITNFTSYSGARDCLKNLTELYCYSSIRTEFFYQLSQVCHTLKTLKIIYKKVISSGLVDLVSVQQNLKYMCMYRFGLHKDLKDTINLISKIPNTLISINIYGGRMHPNISLSFISRFTKLQELILTFYSNEPYRDFSNLQYDIFPYLQRLEFKRECPDNDSLVNFLEINGKNLKEFYVRNSNNLLNLAIIKFCPNLRKLSTKFSNDELDTLKLILNTYQYLENIDIFCKEYMNDLNLIEIVMKNIPKIHYKIILI